MESDDRNPDGALHVRFFMGTEKDNFKSRAEGRDVFFDVPMIQITTPGGLNSIVERLRDDHKARFPKHWAKFQLEHGSGEQVVGTPLKEWPVLSRSRVEELHAMRFYTVDQIANASDQQIAGMGMDGKMLHQKAKAFLRVASDTALAQKQTEELAEKQRQIDEQREQLQALQAQVAALAQNASAPQPPKRKGRPPKAQQTEGQPVEV